MAQHVLLNIRCELLFEVHTVLQISIKEYIFYTKEDFEYLNHMSIVLNILTMLNFILIILVAMNN